MMKSFLYMKFEFNTEITLDETLNTPNDKEIGYFIEVDLKYQGEKKSNTSIFAQKSFLYNTKLLNK